MIAQGKTGNAIERVRNDLGPGGKNAHFETLRRDLCAEAAANLALGVRMQLEGHAERVGRTLARMVIWRRADAAEAEDDVAGGQTAAQRGREALWIIAQVFAPRESQPAARERTDEEGEMFVLALADKDLVADDVDAEMFHASRPSMGRSRSSFSCANR